jgi:hypothetical protein
MFYSTAQRENVKTANPGITFGESLSFENTSVVDARLEPELESR